MIQIVPKKVHGNKILLVALMISYEHKIYLLFFVLVNIYLGAFKLLFPFLLPQDN